MLVLLVLALLLLVPPLLLPICKGCGLLLLHRPPRGWGKPQTASIARCTISDALKTNTTNSAILNSTTGGFHLRVRPWQRPVGKSPDTSKPRTGECQVWSMWLRVRVGIRFHISCLRRYRMPVQHVAKVQKRSFLSCCI